MSSGAARGRRRRHIAALLVALAVVGGRSAQALCLRPSAEKGAQQMSAGCPDSAFVQRSRSAGSTAVAAGLIWPWNDARMWIDRLAWRIEATVGVWRPLVADDAGERELSLQVGLKPAARWALDHRWFVEGGIGLNVIAPRYRAGGRRFSTRLNFGDHIALGLRFGESQRHELQVRVEHFSNAGLRTPNPGENFGQVRYAWRF